jgi:hypothetical protein
VKQLSFNSGVHKSMSLGRHGEKISTVELKDLWVPIM